MSPHTRARKRNSEISCETIPWWSSKWTVRSQAGFIAKRVFDARFKTLAVTVTGSDNSSMRTLQFTADVGLLGQPNHRVGENWDIWWPSL